MYDVYWLAGWLLIWGSKYLEYNSSIRTLNNWVIEHWIVEQSKLNKTETKLGDDQTGMNDSESRQMARRRITLINNSRQTGNEYKKPNLPRPRSYVTYLYLMLIAKKSLKQQNSDKIIFLEKCFLYIFCFRTFPPQWCLFDLPYYAKSTKNPKIQII